VPDGIRTARAREIVPAGSVDERLRLFDAWVRGSITGKRLLVEIN
jgi:hypothetical protein